MARLLRPYVRGELCYLICRSQNDWSLFHSDGERQFFVDLLRRYYSDYDLRIYAYGLLDHEAHLAVQVGGKSLGGFMQQVLGAFARSANRRSGRRGHLFRSRYWKMRLRDPRDLLEVIRHIHYRPVAAGLADHPDEYSWSSHAAYLMRVRVPFVASDALLRSWPTQEVGSYVQFMHTEHAEKYTALEQELTMTAAERRRTPEGQRRAAALVEDIVAAVEHKLALTKADLCSASRRRALSMGRALIAHHACESDVTLTYVSNYLARNPSTLCVGIQRYRRIAYELFSEPTAALLEEARRRGDVPHGFHNVPDAQSEVSLPGNATAQ